MIFSSITFFVFFTITILFIMLVNRFVKWKFLTEEKGMKFRHMILLIASYVFYGWWDWRFCFLMFALTAIAYITARRVEVNSKDKISFVIGIVTPLVILGFFKYFNFFLGSVSSLIGIDNMGSLNIILPVGISFFTFQSMSYTLDVHRGKLEATHDFVKLALYISFFPQLVAGPIIKANDFLPQLNDEKRNVSVKNFTEGLQIFIFGLFKKIIIADYLAVFVDDVFSAPEIFHSGTIILAVVSYSIQIFCDFSGYSDMAYGCAKILGYDLCRNFNVPYMAQNLTEFWKRWHISLSTWLQEYLYFSLGGNRKGKVRTYVNLMITMILGGLWHGASWNFVIWGALHGGALVVHKLYLKLVGKRKKSKPWYLTGLHIVMTYTFVNVCWVFFRAGTLRDAISILTRIFMWDTGIVQIYTWSIVGIIITVICTIVAYYHGKKILNKLERKRRIGLTEGFYPVMELGSFMSFFILFMEIGLLISFAYTGSSPFIYFQF